LVCHRLQHQRVGFLEAPTLEDPSGGEEGTDKGEEAAHGQSRDGARFRVAAIKPRVGDAKAFAPEFSFFAKGAAIADVQFVVLGVRGVEPTLGGKLAKQILFQIVLPVCVSVRRGGDITLLACSVRARAVVERVPTPASGASGAYLLFKALVRVVVPVVRSRAVVALCAVAVSAASRARIRTVHGIKGGERGAASARVAVLDGAVRALVALVVGPAVRAAVAPRHFLAVVPPASFHVAARPAAAVQVRLAVIAVR